MVFSFSGQNSDIGKKLLDKYELERVQGTSSCEQPGEAPDLASERSGRDTCC